MCSNRLHLYYIERCVECWLNIGQLGILLCYLSTQLHNIKPFRALNNLNLPDSPVRRALCHGLRSPEGNHRMQLEIIGLCWYNL